MRIFLVRHGESELSAGVSQVVDCSLTARGRRQSQAVGRLLAPWCLTRILTSPYRRCLETAREISGATGAPHDLHEHHHEAFCAGAWPLPTKSELVRTWPEVTFPGEMPEQRWAAVPEDRQGQWTRICRVLRELLGRFHADPDATIALVTHQAPASVFVQAFCQWSNPLNVRVHIDQASVTTLDIDRTDRRHLVCLNAQPHAPETGADRLS